ncbi:MAG: hypothetical protein JWN06_1017 [Propionibacteriaceae bacterium]|jgi:hypothetical protein|nr:hypothetical protein [Propionibacteriaceae bacterium]
MSTGGSAGGRFGLQALYPAVGRPYRIRGEVVATVETVTLIAAVVAALGGLGAAWIAARASSKQIEAAKDEGELTRRHADELARRAQLQANIDRYTERALSGNHEQALHAVLQLESMAENAELDEMQESAIYAALDIAHQRKFAELDSDNPPQLPGHAEPLEQREDSA